MAEPWWSCTFCSRLYETTAEVGRLNRALSRIFEIEKAKELQEEITSYLDQVHSPAKIWWSLKFHYIFLRPNEVPNFRSGYLAKRGGIQLALKWPSILHGLSVSPDNWWSFSPGSLKLSAIFCLSSWNRRIFLAWKCTSLSQSSLRFSRRAVIGWEVVHVQELWRYTRAVIKSWHNQMKHPLSLVLISFNNRHRLKFWTPSITSNG